MGDPRLLRIAKPVSEFGTEALREVVGDMLDTMRHLNGAGIAAPQIGVDLRVVIFGVEKNPRYPDAESVPLTVLCNPEIRFIGERMEEGWEGCLSVPGLRGVVSRHLELAYRGFTPDGVEIARTATGFHARVVQHECDHLDGVLYPMRVTDFTRFGYTDVLFPGLDAAGDD